MKHGPLVCFGLLAAISALLGAPSATAQSAPKPVPGVLSGVIRDAAGTPQLGASVEVLSEAPGILAARQYLTNTQGIFGGDKLAPGFYTVRVTLAGFLPTLEKHVRISSSLTTVVRIQLESMFASIEQLRRPPVNGSAEPDDWKWVLRSAPGLRPVLQWQDEGTEPGATIVFDGAKPRPLARIELASGTRRPGSVSNIAGAPSTAFAYDQRIDRFNHVVFAGQVTYDSDSPAGGLAALWLPAGSMGTGPQSTIVLREAKISPTGPAFRGVRLDQGGTVHFGDRVLLSVGGEFVLVSVGSTATVLRPRMKLETELSPNWRANLIYAAVPNGTGISDTAASGFDGEGAASALTSALSQLDAFPALLWRNDRPVLENGHHEELTVERKLGTRSLLQVAALHDDNSHVALFGRGNDLPSAEYFQDFYSKGFAYDGGSSNSWGARAAWREKISDDLELTAVYAFSGALTPLGSQDGVLRDALRTDGHHSLAASATARVPKTGTHVSAGYKWVSGTALSRVDPYGEATYQVNPYLHFRIRQPLPRFALGRWEANAECDNLLAQGYTPFSSRDGQVLIVPAFRSFRGGFSVQF